MPASATIAQWFPGPKNLPAGLAIHFQAGIIDGATLKLPVLPTNVTTSQTIIL